ncbi:MAG TPA: hypothetical protein VK142_05850 [Bacillota bacterium]|nr:hypothetical protein [Bacillota bacterium]
MQTNSMWVPLIASIGVGAATYYSVSKNKQDFNEALQEILPVVSKMSNAGNGNNNNYQVASNMATNQASSNTEQLGPYGMS